jgi:hypothetical protein
MTRYPFRIVKAAAAGLVLLAAGPVGPAYAQPGTAAGACPGAPPAVSDSAPFSEAVFRRKAYEGYARNVNGTTTAPLAVGVTFESVRLGAPIKNDVHVDPGRGALRVNDAAPPYTSLYPVVSRHVVCEQYRDGVKHRRVEAVEHCFITRDKLWACGVFGALNITQID